MEKMRDDDEDEDGSSKDSWPEEEAKLDVIYLNLTQEIHDPHFASMCVSPRPALP